jgi:hypothetical protein
LCWRTAALRCVGGRCARARHGLTSSDQLRLWCLLLLGVLLAAQVSLAIPVITTVPWTRGFPSGAEKCSNALTGSDASHLYCALNYPFTAIVDLTIFVLTMQRLSQAQGGTHSTGIWSMMSADSETLGRRSIVQLLFQHGTMAVLLALLFNMPVMVLEFVHRNGQAVYIPYNIGVPANAMISCHIIMALYSWKRPQMRRGLFSSASGGDKGSVLGDTAPTLQSLGGALIIEGPGMMIRKDEDAPEDAPEWERRS